MPARSWRHSAHAFSLIDSYIYGFVLQEVNLPFEFECGLGLILDSLEAAPHA